MTTSTSRSLPRRGGGIQAVSEQPSTASFSTCVCPTFQASMYWSNFRDTPSLGDLPVVVFTGKELSPEEDARLHSLARSVVVKGVESPERLLDETALFLHRVVADLPVENRRCSTGCTVPTMPWWEESAGGRR
jgi:hypothetical protein